ncbi:MAG: hypothetical protein M3N07_10365 [Pseudomonadota bacterium]|nr:hypothetical protein [Pseudomonadota bacterium]
MLERLEEEGRRLAERCRERRRRALAAQLAAELPGGIAAEETEEGVRLSGRGLARRLILDPRLRALIGRLA